MRAKHADRIAVHLLATQPGGDAETVNTLRQAAKGASNRGAPDVAVTYLQRALAEPPSPELEPELVHELGTAALSAGELDMAIEQLRQATRDLADGRLRAEAANALGSALFLAQRPEEAMTDLTAVIDELPESEREQGLRLQATRWAAARGSVAVWRRLEATGERFVVTSRTPRTIGERLQVAAAAYDAARTGTAAEARELALQALADGRLLEDPGPESGGFWIAPFVLLLAHADDDAGAGQHRGDRVGEAARVAAGVLDGGSAARVRLPASRLAGRRGGGRDERARAPRRSGLVPLRPHGARQRAARAGQGHRSADVFAQVRVRARSSRSHPLPADARSPASGLAAPRGRARGSVRLRPARAGVGDPHARVLHLARRRRAAAGIARPPRRGRALAREELERCRAFGAPGPLGVSLRTLGVVEPGDAGIALLEQAVAQLERSPARLEHALALLELGAATRRAGRRADARKPLREALELARACGADAVAARAHDELVAAGARPRRDPTESRSNLTASELRVARMAAEGMTNREIAQALFLTENTIETHLRSVFRKLEIRSRSQLARAL